MGLKNITPKLQKADFIVPWGMRMKTFSINDSSFQASKLLTWISSPQAQDASVQAFCSKELAMALSLF